MRRLLLILLLPVTALSDVEFATRHGTQNYFTPCFPLYSTASDGAGTLSGMSGSDTDFVISIQYDNAASSIEFQTTSDIETISTIGTYASPTANTDIRFGECDTEGTYQLQFHDDHLSASNAKMMTIKLTDDVDTMADQIVYINLNFASLDDLSGLIDARLAAYGAATSTDVDDAVSSLESTIGDGVTLATGAIDDAAIADNQTELASASDLDFVSISVGGLQDIISEIADVTDQFNFGVSGKVDANVTHMNESEVCGDGDSTAWNGKCN